MRKFQTFVAVAALFAAGPALAQATAAPAAGAAAGVTAGAAVTDTAGGAVGTIQSVDGEFVVLKTDRHQVRLPASSFTKSDTGYIFGMTQAALNASVDQELAKAQASIAPGAVVRGPQGNPVGTIDAVDAEFVTLKLEGGEQLVRLPKAAVAGSAQGPVIGLTLTQLQAQVGAPAAGAEPTGSN